MKANDILLFNGKDEIFYPEFYDDEEAYEAFLKRTSAIEPDNNNYEYLGRVQFKDSEQNWHKILNWEKRASEILSAESSFQDDDIPDFQFDPDKDLGVLVSADGRVFKQKKRLLSNSRRNETFVCSCPKGHSINEVKNKLRHGIMSFEENLRTNKISINIDRDVHLLDELENLRLTTGPDTPQFSVLGSDGRELITSSQYPWRAVGVAIIPTSGSYIRGSGAMIGPRHVLTAAHVINSSGDISDLSPVRAAPGARGSGYPGNRWPFGRRFVQWYYWPNGWDGGNWPHDRRYDYALLVLDNINWSPGYVFFGYQSTTWLDFKHFNTSGYPGNSQTCVDSPLSPRSCGGYMYRQYERVTSVLPGYFYHKFDTQGGQSGSPIYWYDGESTRIIYGVHVASGNISNLAHRIRSGSFNSLCSWIGDWPSSYFPNPTC